MRRSVVYPIFVLSALGALSSGVRAQGNEVAVTNLDGQSRFNTDQLDNLAGPVALYPDALLAQVLVAATFPDQVSDAAVFVRANGTANIDNQQWDISVKAVAHYPSALNAMADKIDWTTALGQAYASQSSEVMQSVQRLRSMAAANGNLNSTQQQQVIQQGTTYEIVPVQPRVIYVPVYDPYVIYSRPIFNLTYSSRFWSFGVGFPIGAWLSYDVDWGQRRVYYNGWEPEYYGYSGNWRLRSQPFIRVSDIYVSPRYRSVYVNRAVATRVVDYRNVDRYASVHGGSHFEGRYDNRVGDVRRDGGNYSIRDNNGRGNSGGYGGRDNNGRDNNGRVNGGADNDRGQRAGQAQNGDGYRGARNANGARTNGNTNGGTSANTNSANGNRNSQPQTDSRVAVPRQRRSEPAQRSGDAQPQLMTPERAAEVSHRQSEVQGQARPQPQQQAQPQQTARPQAAPQREAQPRQAPPAAQRGEQRSAPQTARPEQHGKPAETRPDRGRGGDRGDDSRHRGGF